MELLNIPYNILSKLFLESFLTLEMNLFERVVAIYIYVDKDGKEVEKLITGKIVSIMENQKNPSINIIRKDNTSYELYATNCFDEENMQTKVLIDLFSWEKDDEWVHVYSLSDIYEKSIGNPE